MNEIEFLSIPLIEWIGYLASTLVLISLSLSSMLRLRIFNFFGSAVFSFYGFFIGSLPVGIMNLIIVVFNCYYLTKLYFKKDDFEIIESMGDKKLIQKFIVHHKRDIQKFFPDFNNFDLSNTIALMVMRNMNLAGVFIAQEKGETLNVEVDYISPQYRDYKNGAFLFAHFREALKEKKYTRVEAETSVPQQIKYLSKMGFTRNMSAVKSNQYYLCL